MAKFDQRLIPNYIAVLAIIFTFLGGFVYVLVYFEEVRDSIIVEGNSEASAVNSSVATAIVTAMIFITKEATSFLFRKTPSPVPETT